MITIIGGAAEKEPLISLTIQGSDVKKAEKFLNDEYNIVCRAGELTARRPMKVLGIEGALHFSFAFFQYFR